jgi:hypothetical protein
MPGPVGGFMGQRGVIAFRVAEEFKGGHLHMVGGGGIERPVAAVADVGPSGREEGLQAGQALRRRKKRGLGHRVIHWAGRASICSTLNTV